MRINNVGNNNINFGWSCETHKKIMDTALNDFPQLEKYRNVLNDYVQRPDHDDIGFLANKHFYFGDKNSNIKDIFKFSMELPQKEEDSTGFLTGIKKAYKKIFNIDGTSFMDYNGRNNAKAAYEDEIDRINYANDDGDTDWAMQSVARACHFLQDMTQPQHTEETSVFGKAVDLKIHNDFENKSTEYTDTFVENYKAKADTLPKMPSRNFKSIFNDVYRNTKEMTPITQKNEKDWDKIGQAQFDSAVQATKAFLTNACAMLGLNQNNP